MNAPDRIEELLEQSLVTGIDFIYVYPDQVTLDVYFLRQPGTLSDPLPGGLAPDAIRIYNPEGNAPDIPVVQLDWATVEGREVMRLQTAFPGDFTLYRFKINDQRIDPFYNDVTFSFKANCPSELDCAPPPYECPLEEEVDVPIDYLARDFWSFRRALLEMAALRYPDWPDRLEADAGVMLAEVMSALGDEMAYYQDRVAREAYLETATQRRSLRRHARLVDYHLHDGLGARAWLDVTVKPGESGIIIPGKDVGTGGESRQPITFEVGRGLRDAYDYGVDAQRNEFLPHLWDEDENCLPVGTTELFIKGHWADQFTSDDPYENRPGIVPGKWALLQTLPPNPAQPARVHLVRVVKATDTNDPVFAADITHLAWEEEQALPFELDLALLKVRGNILPATAGKTYTAYFVIRAGSTDYTQEEWQELHKENNYKDAQRAIEREAHDGESVIYLFTLPGSDQLPLVWLGDDPRQAAPEIILQELTFEGGRWVAKQEGDWEWKGALIGVNSSQPEDQHFTLEDGSWRRVVGYQRSGEEFVHQDYASNAGVTIRFGDGEFGAIPPEKTVFKVTYRLGGTRRSNVAADTLTRKEDLPFVEKVTNPLPASGGLDAETPSELRQLAPEAFRAVTYRAVRPEDYAEAAERLPWVQRAGAVFRWTGSWLSAFATPDPKGVFLLEEERRTELVRHLGRFRQAGREVHVMKPLYANLDLEIDVCALPSSYRGEVKERVLEALLGKKGVRAREGYFGPDRFTFGTPLERSTLEAAIQATPGVKAVDGIRFRRRGWFDWQAFTELAYSPGRNAIIRLANDPLHPERGTLKIYINGGA